MQIDNLYLLRDSKWLDLCISSILELLRFQVRNVFELNIVLLVHVNQHHSCKDDRFLPIKINANYPYSRYCRLNSSQGQSVKGAPTLLELLCKWVGPVSWQGGNSSSYLTDCLLASPMLRTCDREHCWNLAVWKTFPTDILLPVAKTDRRHRW